MSKAEENEKYIIYVPAMRIEVPATTDSIGDAIDEALIEVRSRLLSDDSAVVLKG